MVTRVWPVRYLCGSCSRNGRDNNQSKQKRKFPHLALHIWASGTYPITGVSKAPESMGVASSAFIGFAYNEMAGLGRKLTLNEVQWVMETARGYRMLRTCGSQ